MKRDLLLPLFSILFLLSCQKDKLTPDYKYVFLGHIYQTATRVDERIEKVDLSKYQQIWLGGDVCRETTHEEATLDYLDELFDLGKSTTHWTLGNHDTRNGNLEWITSRTRRPTFYTHSFDGITLLNLNSRLREPQDCEAMATQFEMIQAVSDTIATSEYLILLMHHVAWGGVEEDLRLEDYANTDAFWLPFVCMTSSRFVHTIYPELLKAKSKGIEVICIAGDMGQKASSFEYVDRNGITFLASGITSETDWNEQFSTHGKADSVLIFSHDPIDRSLDWEFVNIANL